MASSFRRTPTITSARQAQLDADVAKKVQARLNAEAAKKIIERGGNIPTRMAGSNPVLSYFKNNPLSGGAAVLGTLWDARLIPEEMQKARDEGRDPNRALVEALVGLASGGISAGVGTAMYAEPGDLFVAPTIIGSTLYEVGDEYGRKGTRKLLNFVLGEEEITSKPMANEKEPPVPEDITKEELERLNKTIVAPLPETRPPTVVNQEPVPSTSNNMQSELLKEATTMRRAKEMKELGIHGGDEAMNEGSPMHTWLSTHGELADNLIRDKRMREVRVAREFDREFDGTMGDFEAFKVNREVG